MVILTYRYIGNLNKKCSLILDVCLFSYAAEENHSDSRFSEQKEPPLEDKTHGAEEAGAGVLPSGSLFPPSNIYGMMKKD